MKRAFGKQWLADCKRVLGYDRDEAVARARHTNFRAFEFIKNMQKRITKLERENDKLRKTNATLRAKRPGKKSA